MESINTFVASIAPPPPDHRNNEGEGWMISPDRLSMPDLLHRFAGRMVQDPVGERLVDKQGVGVYDGGVCGDH